MTDDNFCCTPDSGDCCGPGSWCCARAGKHEHPELASENPYPVAGERVQGIWADAPHGVLLETRYSDNRGMTVADVQWDSGSRSWNLDLEMIEKEKTT